MNILISVSFTAGYACSSAFQITENLLISASQRDSDLPLQGHTDSKPGQQTNFLAPNCSTRASKRFGLLCSLFYPFSTVFPLPASNLWSNWLFPGNPPTKHNKKTLKQRLLKLLPCCPSGSSSSVNESKCKDTHFLMTHID